MKRIDYKMTRRVTISCVFVTLLMSITLFVVLPGILNAQSDPLLDQKVKKAILAEEWTKVVDVLGPDSNLTSLPVARLIKGHACLALNRNNESLCLFLSVTSEGDLKKWKDWTQEFAKKNPKSAIACYFEGDAFARLEQWDSALVALDKGLELDSNHALILNARGVTHVAKGEWDSAYVYLTKATVANDSFADAHASLGAMWIHRRTGAKGALERFSQALKVSPNFALALNGRGCAQFALGHWDEAKMDFEEAGKRADCLDLTNINLLGLNKAKVELMSIQVDELVEDTAGMSVERRTHLGNIRNDIGLTKSQISSIEGAQWRIHNWWKPIWHGVSGIPWVGGLGRGMVDKLNNRTSINEKTLDRFYSSTGCGVDLEKIRGAYIDRGNWPVVTWVGLVYYVKPVEFSSIKGSEKK